MYQKDKYEAQTLQQLAIRYKVSKRTLKKWINMFIPEVLEKKGSYILTPEQVRRIIEELG